jgi:hypothetical protein
VRFCFRVELKNISTTSEIVNLWQSITALSVLCLRIAGGETPWQTSLFHAMTTRVVVVRYGNTRIGMIDFDRLPGRE